MSADEAPPVTNPSPELAALRAEAAADAAPAPGQAPAAPGAVVVKPETWEDWREALKLAVAWASGPYPGLKAIYTADALDQLAQACFAVAQKYGWSISGLWLRWKEEIVLLLVAWPLLRDTAKVIEAAKKPAKAAPASVADIPAASAAPAGVDGNTLKPSA